MSLRWCFPYRTLCRQEAPHPGDQRDHRSLLKGMRILLPDRDGLQTGAMLILMQDLLLETCGQEPSLVLSLPDAM